MPCIPPPPVLLEEEAGDVPTVNSLPGITILYPQSAHGSCTENILPGLYRRDTGQKKRGHGPWLDSWAVNPAQD